MIPLKIEESTVKENDDKITYIEKLNKKPIAVTHNIPSSVVQACRIACDITNYTIALDIGEKENYVDETTIFRESAQKNTKISHRRGLSSYSMKSAYESRNLTKEVVQISNTHKVPGSHRRVT